MVVTLRLRMKVESERAWRYEIGGRLSTLSITSILMVVAIASGAAELPGKLKSFNRKPQARALGMNGLLSAVSANTHACGLRLNDLSAIATPAAACGATVLAI